MKPKDQSIIEESPAYAQSLVAAKEMKPKKKSLVGWTDKRFFYIAIDKRFGEIYLNGIYSKQKEFLNVMYHPLDKNKPIKVRITIEHLTQ